LAGHSVACHAVEAPTAASVAPAFGFNPPLSDGRPEIGTQNSRL
jgi:hypothetical protein